MGDKTTIMVLKVDLQCCSYYKKVKKILCKFPQIRNQVYDEENNTVTISVVCCDPEKLRDKLCSKGCGVIKSIEIKEPPKVVEIKKPPKVVEIKDPPKVDEIREPPKKEPNKTPMLIQVYPQHPPGYCCGQCYEGHNGGPCYQLYGRPVPQPPCYHYCGCSYGPCPGPCGYGRRCYVSRCDQYVFSDENATGCSIM